MDWRISKAGSGLCIEPVGAEMLAGLAGRQWLLS
jgi:hypothetical protein